MKRPLLPSAFAAARTALLVALLGASLSPSPAADEVGWISLFNGVSLAGWKASENPGSFRVVDGTIITDGPRSHLFYVGTGATPASFENFELSLEVMTKPDANSGVYFHTSWLEQGWPTHQGFEVQVDNSQPLQGDYIENKRTGSLYGIRNVYPKLARDNEWFTLNVVVRKPRVEIRVNGMLVVDYVEPAEPLPASAPKFNHLGSGSFALQAHDAQSHTSFRNIRVRPLPPAPAGSIVQPPLDAELARILPLAKDNFPLIDLHLVLGDSKQLERALAVSRETGIGIGVVANTPERTPSNGLAGARFQPAETEAAALAFLQAMESRPVFRVLRPEKRDWTQKISAATRARFDCIIADASTFARPTASNPQAFMDALVAQTVEILTREPVDIYGNATFLPIELVGNADELWTEARMQKVIAAAVANGVAIEINTVHVLPSERFIRLAKAAGAKFSIGSGNTDAEVLEHSYAWEMQTRTGLTWRDMYAPGHKPTRAQQALAASGAASAR
ncbi:MAG: family 16 glycoside hydrolase [Opitutaceae bacterium]